MTALGIDIGGTTIKHGLFTSPDEELASASQPTPSDYPSLLAELVALIRAAQQKERLQVVGVGVPGFIYRPQKRIVISPNLPFLNDAALEADLQRQIDLPLVVENDANMAAFAEYSNLPAPQPSSFVHLTLGTGIGSGIVLEGKIWLGKNGFAAELGHVVVNADGRACGCGGRGCAETESSELGIVTSYGELAHDKSATSAKMVFDLYRQDHPAARRAFARAGYYLGILLADIANVLNPAVISLGGGVAAAGEALLKPAQAEFVARFRRGSYDDTDIRLATLGNHAGMIGAARWAMTFRS